MSVCLLGTHLLRNGWTDLADILHITGMEVCLNHGVSYFGGDRPGGLPSPDRGADRSRDTAGGGGQKCTVTELASV